MAFKRTKTDMNQTLNTLFMNSIDLNLVQEPCNNRNSAFRFFFSSDVERKSSKFKIDAQRSQLAEYQSLHLEQLTIQLRSDNFMQGFLDRKIICLISGWLMWVDYCTHTRIVQKNSNFNAPRNNDLELCYFFQDRLNSWF